MAARKMPSSGPSTYAFSTAPEDLFKKSANRSRHFLGKLHAFSSATTEYVLVDAGAKPLEGARRATSASPQYHQDVRFFPFLPRIKISRFLRTTLIWETLSSRALEEIYTRDEYVRGLSRDLVQSLEKTLVYTHSVVAKIQNGILYDSRENRRRARRTSGARRHLFRGSQSRRRKPAPHRGGAARRPLAPERPGHGPHGRDTHSSVVKARR